MKARVIKVNKSVTVYESISGRYFKCTIEKLMRHVYIFNLKRRTIKHSGIRLNAWFKQIGLSGIEIGDALVWPSWKNVGDIDVQYEVMLDFGTPVIVLVYTVSPIYKL
jgi:hypothetical protein